MWLPFFKEASMQAASTFTFYYMFQLQYCSAIIRLAIITVAPYNEKSKCHHPLTRPLPC